MAPFTALDKKERTTDGQSEKGPIIHARLAPAANCLSSTAIAATGVTQSPAVLCRNNRIVGYQGESVRSINHRQSGTRFSNVQTGFPNAPANCTTAVSIPITKSN